MLAGDGRLGRQLVLERELDPPGLARDRAEAAWDDGDVLGGLVLEDPELGGAVVLEGPVPVEVVRRQVEQDRRCAGRKVSTSSSWKLESSHTIQAPSPSAPSSPVSGRPTFPATATSLPAARKMSPSSSLVVVLPFVPVTPRIGLARSRKPSSTSLQTVTPRSRAAAAKGSRRRYAWAFHKQVHAVEKLGVVRAEDDFDTCLAKPPRVDVLPPVDPDDVHASPRQRERRRLARAGEAEDERFVRKPSY